VQQLIGKVEQSLASEDQVKQTQQFRLGIKAPNATTSPTSTSLGKIAQDSVNRIDICCILSPMPRQGYLDEGNERQ
jgi:hypothetical protein